MTHTPSREDRQRDLTAWLDDAADELTADQWDALIDASEMIDTRYPIPADGPEDVADDREQALNAALGVILAETTVESITTQWKATRSAEATARAAMTGAMIAASVAGESEYGLSQRTGVTRTTIRKALGK